VAQEKKKYWIIAGLSLFFVYFFTAARPIPRETILSPRWLSSLDSEYPVLIGENAVSPDSENSENSAPPRPGDSLIPFILGDHFGYVDSEGVFSMNRVKSSFVSLAENYWTEYDAEPERVEVFNVHGGRAALIEKSRSYPLLLDGRIFLVGSEQNSLSALDDSGKILWTYDFAAPLTCVDAAGGIILAGSLDGVVEVLDDAGKLVFSFEPGGSRLSVILGCAVSGDGSRLGIISGIDDQRFLLLERFGGTAKNEYRVVYHEFLEDGFRRGTYISFIEEDSHIVFERQGGLGIYNISARKSFKIPLEGEIKAIDSSGGDGLFFVISSPRQGQKKLIAVRLTGQVVMEAPFKGETAFLRRSGSRIYLGGGKTIASFELEKR
jgi:hypothetical protein